MGDCIEFPSVTPTYEPWRISSSRPSSGVRRPGQTSMAGLPFSRTIDRWLRLLTLLGFSVIYLVNWRWVHLKISIFLCIYYFILFLMTLLVLLSYSLFTSYYGLFPFYFIFIGYHATLLKLLILLSILFLFHFFLLFISFYFIIIIN